MWRDMCSILLFHMVASIETIYVRVWRMFAFCRCSDCVGLYVNVCSEAGVVKDSRV